MNFQENVEKWKKYAKIRKIRKNGSMHQKIEILRKFMQKSDFLHFL